MTALGLLLARKLWTGEIFYYINERFFPLILFGALASLTLALGAFWMWRREATAYAHDHEHGHDHDHVHAHAPIRFPVWSVFWVAVPVVLSLVVPSRPLGASAIENRGLNSSGPLTVGSGAAVATLQIAPADRSILDWIRAFNYSADPAEFNGQPADVIGFVYKDPNLPANQFWVGRFVVTCCAADASAVALLAEWPEATALPENAWVRVRGPVHVAEFNGRPTPLIVAAALEQVEQPEHPYMYP
ncbi:MAG: TIGR03943 family protein [Anaerolineales bacterium]|nr:TIGR03943 family protein [Anaerolineales bacterium]